MPTALGLRFGIPCLPQRATPFEHSHKPHPEMLCVLSKVHSATIRHLEKASRKRHISPEYRSDRKSTRLNSSHPSISYAVFCLKKKKTKTDIIYTIPHIYT